MPAAPKVQQPPPPVAAVLNYEPNNRQLANELEKLRQLCQLKETRILELNADNFGLREYIGRLEQAVEESRTIEVEMNEKLEHFRSEFMKMKAFCDKFYNSYGRSFRANDGSYVQVHQQFLGDASNEQSASRGDGNNESQSKTDNSRMASLSTSITSTNLNQSNSSRI